MIENSGVDNGVKTGLVREVAKKQSVTSSLSPFSMQDGGTSL